MRRMISIVDLATGCVSQRPSDTPTIDLPSDFDRKSKEAALDAKSHARYSTTSGTSASLSVHARPLSWRVRGEECLVAVGPSVAQRSRYSLCAVDPAE